MNEFSWKVLHKKEHRKIIINAVTVTLYSTIKYLFICVYLPNLLNGILISESPNSKTFTSLSRINPTN